MENNQESSTRPKSRRTPLRTIYSRTSVLNAQAAKEGETHLAGPSQGEKWGETKMDLAGPSNWAKLDKRFITFRKKSTEGSDDESFSEKNNISDKDDLNLACDAEDIAKNLSVSHHECLPILHPKGIDGLDQAAIAAGANNNLAEYKLPTVPMVSSAARSRVINWLLKIHGGNGNPLVIEAACFYLDSYLSSAKVEDTHLQLIAAACYVIASKLNSNSPWLLSRLVKESGGAFLKEDLSAAVRNVFKKMGFKANVMTPAIYIPYFSRYCDLTKSGIVEAASTFLSQCALMVDKKIFLEYPSVLAAAAVNNAVTLLKDNDVSVLELDSCPLYKSAESKAEDLHATSARMLEALRRVCAEGYRFKAPLEFKAPPHNISDLMVRALKNLDNEEDN